MYCMLREAVNVRIMKRKDEQQQKKKNYSYYRVAAQSEPCNINIDAEQTRWPEEKRKAASTLACIARIAWKLNEYVYMRSLDVG